MEGERQSTPLMKRNATRSRALAIFAAVMIEMSSAVSAAPAGVSYSIAVQSSTITAGSNPAIQVTVTNPTGSSYAFFPSPVLQVVGANGQSLVPVQHHAPINAVVVASPGRTAYVYGSSTSYLTVSTFREWLSPGTYSISYCEYGATAAQNLCSNAVSITLQ